MPISRNNSGFWWNLKENNEARAPYYYRSPKKDGITPDCTYLKVSVIPSRKALRASKQFSFHHPAQIENLKGDHFPRPRFWKLKSFASIFDIYRASSRTAVS